VVKLALEIIRRAAVVPLKCKRFFGFFENLRAGLRDAVGLILLLLICWVWLAIIWSVL
jgi:hypothetical protein